MTEPIVSGDRVIARYYAGTGRAPMYLWQAGATETLDSTFGSIDSVGEAWGGAYLGE